MIFLDLVFSEENKNYNETLRWKYFVQTVIPFFHFQCFFKHESPGFEVDESRERLASIYNRFRHRIFELFQNIGKIEHRGA